MSYKGDWALDPGNSHRDTDLIDKLEMLEIDKTEEECNEPHQKEGD